MNFKKCMIQLNCHIKYCNCNISEEMEWNFSYGMHCRTVRVIWIHFRIQCLENVFHCYHRLITLLLGNNFNNCPWQQQYKVGIKCQCQVRVKYRSDLTVKNQKNTLTQSYDTFTEHFPTFNLPSLLSTVKNMNAFWFLARVATIFYYCIFIRSSIRYEILFLYKVISSRSWKRHSVCVI